MNYKQWAEESDEDIGFKICKSIYREFIQLQAPSGEQFGVCIREDDDHPLEIDFVFDVGIAKKWVSNAADKQQYSVAYSTTINERIQAAKAGRLEIGDYLCGGWGVPLSVSFNRMSSASREFFCFNSESGIPAIIDLDSDSLAAMTLKEDSRILREPTSRDSLLVYLEVMG